MKSILISIVVAIAAYILGLFLPWWSIVIPTFIAGSATNYKKRFQAFIGFISIACLWWLLAILAYNSNAQAIAEMVGNIFQGLSPIGIIAITGILGGLYGGIAQLCGYFFRKIIKK